MNRDELKNLIRQMLNEAPLGSFTTIGDFEKRKSFKDPRDIKSLKHPDTIKKSIARTQNLEEAQAKLDMIARTIPYYLNDVLYANVGEIFVM